MSDDRSAPRPNALILRTLALVPILVGVIGGAAIWLGGDRITSERQDHVADEFGALDVELRVTDDADAGSTLTQHLGDLDDEIRHSSVPATDGLLTALISHGSLSVAGDDPQPACVTQVNLASVRHFGPDESITGGAGAPSRVRAGHIVLTEPAATRFAAEVGDTVAFTGPTDGATPTDFEVQAIVPSVGALSRCDGIVPDGTITTGNGGSTAAIEGVVWMSADGGVDNSVATAAAVGALHAKFSTRDWVDISTPKVDRVAALTDTRRVWHVLGAMVGAAGALLSVGMLIVDRRHRTIRRPTNPAT